MSVSDPADARLAAALERLATAARAHYQREAERTGLSPLQIQLLLLTNGAAQPLGVVTAAAHLDVSQPTVSDAVAALVSKGLLTSQPATTDRRRRELRLTDSGADALAGVTTFETLLQRHLAEMPPALRTDPVSMALQLIGALHRDGVVTVARMCTTCRFFQPRPHADQPHHCRLLDAPLEPAWLRLDCPEHEPIAP